MGGDVSKPTRPNTQPHATPLTGVLVLDALRREQLVRREERSAPLHDHGLLAPALAHGEGAAGVERAAAAVHVVEHDAAVVRHALAPLRGLVRVPARLAAAVHVDDAAAVHVEEDVDDGALLARPREDGAQPLAERIVELRPRVQQGPLRRAAVLVALVAQLVRARDEDGDISGTAK